MTKLSFWDWLAYIALAILIAYFLLKTLEITRSPLGIDVVAIISGSYLIERYTMKIDLMFNEINQIKKRCISCE